MTTKISASTDGLYGSLVVGATEALRFGSDNSGQLAGFRNKIINGGFDITQRGTSFTLNTQYSSAYSADRWIIALDSASASLVCTFGQDANPTAGWPDNARYCVLTGTTISPSTPGYIIQRVEGVRTLAGQTATLSYREQLLSGTDTGPAPYLQQRFGSGGSGDVNVSAISDVKVGQKRILTFNIPNTLGKTIGANDFLNIVIPVAGTFSKAFGGMQFEKGGIATPFEERPVGLELSLCQRYFCKVDALALTTNTFGSQSFPVQMRISPTITAAFNAGSGGEFRALNAQTSTTGFYQSTGNSATATATLSCNAEL
jgi:hypothetical protein